MCDQCTTCHVCSVIVESDIKTPAERRLWDMLDLQAAEEEFTDIALSVQSQVVEEQLQYEYEQHAQLWQGVPAGEMV